MVHIIHFAKKNWFEGNCIRTGRGGHDRVIIPRDPIVNQAATILTGNPQLQRVIEHCQTDIKQMLHKLSTLLR